MFDDAQATADRGTGAREGAIARYGFSIPTDDALDHISRCSPAGVVELGAGTGYWALLLHNRGVEVEAYDIEPPPAKANFWFAGTEPWHPVQRADHTIVKQFADRTLLIVWPTKDDVWAAAALELYHEAGGTCVVFVGEVGGGGHTGDDVFHARLGELGACLQCTYGVVARPAPATSRRSGCGRPPCYYPTGPATTTTSMCTPAPIGDGLPPAPDRFAPFKCRTAHDPDRS